MVGSRLSYIWQYSLTSDCEEVPCPISVVLTTGFLDSYFIWATNRNTNIITLPNKIKKKSKLLLITREEARKLQFSKFYWLQYNFG